MALDPRTTAAFQLGGTQAGEDNELKLPDALRSQDHARTSEEKRTGYFL
jgi:hypothetical protein